MQTVGGYGDRRGGAVIRLALTFILAAALAAPANGETAEDSPAKKPIPLNKKSAVSKNDARLASALAKEPVMERGLTVESPLRIVEYFMNRPELASRLMAQSDVVSGEIHSEEDADGWTFTGKSGARYVFRPAQAGKDVRFVRFSYFHGASMGIGLRISGSGAVVVSVSHGKTGETTALDYDVYFTEGGRPLDKMAVRVSIHMAEIMGDFTSLAEGFVTLCEAVNDYPESVADEMRDADDVFTKKEIDEFESAMGVKRRGKAR